MGVIDRVLVRGRACTFLSADSVATKAYVVPVMAVNGAGGLATLTEVFPIATVIAVSRGLDSGISTNVVVIRPLGGLGDL